MIKAITTKITNAKDEDGKSLFIAVRPATEVADAMAKSLNASHVAFIVPLEEKPITDELDTGQAIQKQHATIGVLIGLRSVGNSEDDNERLIELRKNINKELFGWTPASGHKALLKGLCNMQKLQPNQQLFWMERFTTEFYLESEYV